MLRSGTLRTNVETKAVHLLALVWIVVASCQSGFASEEKPSRELNIPAGRAVKAVSALAHQFETNILFTTAAYGDVMTNEVSGAFTVKEALSLMLQDTSLVAVPVSGGKAFGIIHRSQYVGDASIALNGEGKRKSKKRGKGRKKTVDDAKNGKGLFGAIFSFVVSLSKKNDAQIVNTGGDVYELSPFEVDFSNDDGWHAGSTLVGTRANSELKNVPLSVDALTVDFMEDMGIHDLDDAAEFIAGVDVIQRDETLNDSETLSFRGLPIADTPREGTQTTRNFFIWYPRADVYNVERLDFNKGSNSLMFGNAGPGGLATIYTKQARFENFGKITAEYGSYDSHRIMIDVNQKISDKVALRFNAVDMTENTYLDFTEDFLRGYDLAGTFKFSENSRLRFEAEDLKYRRIQGTSDIVMDVEAAETDGFSGNRTTYTSDGSLYDASATTVNLAELISPGEDPDNYEGVFYPSDGAGGFLDPIAVEDNEAGAGGNEASLALGQFVQVYSETGEPLQVVGPLPRKVNARGPRNFFDRDINNYSLWLDHRFGNLDVEIAWNRQEQLRHINGSDPGTDISLTGSGSIAGDNRFFIEGGSLGEKKFGNDTDTVRLTASFPIDWDGVTKQFFVGNVTYLDDLATSFRYRWHNLAAARDPETGEIDPTFNLEDNSDTRLRHRIYFADLAADLGNFDRWTASYPENMPVMEGVLEPVLLQLTDPNKPFVDKRYTRSASLSAAGEYFGGRLKSLFGVRRDEFAMKRYQVDQRILDGDDDIPVDSSLLEEFGEKAYYGQDPFAGMPHEAPEYYEFEPAFDQSATTYSAGLIYKVTRDMNVYLNRSTSFQWQATEDFLGRPILAEEGETREIGFKGEFLDGLFAIGGAYYEIDRNNVAYRMVNSISADNMEILFNPLALNTRFDRDGNIREIEYDNPDDDAVGFVEISRGINGESRKIRAVELVEGWELNLLMRRSHGLQARLALSGNDILSAPEIEDYEALVAKAESGWPTRLAAIQEIDPRITDSNWDDDEFWRETYGLRDSPVADDEKKFREDLDKARGNIFAARSGLITGSRARPLMASWVLDYMFNESFFLPNLRVIVFGRYADKYLMDINDEINWHGGSTHPVSLGFRYSLNLSGNPLDIRLSIKNLLDFENKDDVKGFEGFVDDFTGEKVIVLRNIQPTIAEISFVYKF